MTPERLAEIKARCETATPGEWEPRGCDLVVVVDQKSRMETTVAEAVRGYETGDAEFIANSRQDIPDLVAEVERAQLNERAAVEAADGYLLEIDIRNKKIAGLRAEVERLRAALYAATPTHSLAVCACVMDPFAACSCGADKRRDRIDAALRLPPSPAPARPSRAP